MSSEDEVDVVRAPRAPKANPSWTRRGLKVRETLRACDACRRRKVKCDAHTGDKTKCSTCQTFKLECTFIEEAKKRGLPKGYAIDLEERVRKIEALLARVAPEVDVEAEIGPSFTQSTWEEVKGGDRATKSREKGKLKSDSPPSSRVRSPDDGLVIKAANASEALRCMFPTDTVELDLQTMSVMTELPDLNEDFRISQGNIGMFHGKSSDVGMVEWIFRLKSHPGQRTYVHLRPEFWSPNQWETIEYKTVPLGDVDWPPDDLMDQLVENCFTKGLALYPVLHRPSFDRQLKAGAHLKDEEFAKLVLLVCAIGSRYVDDQRVLMQNSAGEYDLGSAGWKYFLFTMRIHNPLITALGLSDLQGGALAAIFTTSSNALHAPWVITGILLRAAMDHGAHREHVYGGDPAHAFRNQMWKRLFWSMVTLDRVSSSALGRTVAIFDEDIDAELPLEVDDEYYDEETKQWKQPEGKPAIKLAAFVQWVRLNTIHAYAARTLYAINKSKAAFASTPNWEADTVVELDSALNAWEDALPDFLKWDPKTKDLDLLRLTAQLRSGLHYIQILIHRRFFLTATGGRRPNSLNFASLAICGNAARSILGVIDACDKAGLEIHPNTHGAAFTACTVLLVCMWDAKRSRTNADVSRYSADIKKCIRILHSLEERWQIAGRLCDIITELAFMSDTDVSPADALRKRAREGGDDSVPFRQNPFLARMSETSPDSQTAPSFGASALPPQAGMIIDNTFPDLETSLMTLFGPTADRDAAIQWDPADTMFSFGGLPMLDTSWDNYLLSGLGSLPGAGMTVDPIITPSQPSSSNAFGYGQDM